MAERGIIFKDDFVSTPGKSWFDLSYDYLFSMNFGELVPSSCVECLAEDVIHAKSDSFVRLAPLVAPTFGKCNMFSYHFYVRNRSIWKQWEEFFADNDQREAWQQANPSWTPPEMPYISPLKILDAQVATAFVNSIGIQDPDNLLKDVQLSYRTPGYHLSATHVNNLQLLVIDAANGGSVEFHNCVNEHDSCYFTRYYDSSNYDHESIFIAFIPNKYDSNIVTTFANPSFKANSPEYYNVFSNGTLFDYLGVDLSGHYFHQFDVFERELGKIRTALSDSSAQLELVDGEILLNGNVLFDMKGFLSRYKVVLYGYNHNHQMVSVNAHDGKYHLTGEQTHSTEVYALEEVVNYTYEGKISTLPLRAYHQIYIDYFRDENYISVNKNIDWSRDGEDIDWSIDFDTFFDFLTLNIKAYEHDPYTTALPQPQRGNPVRFLSDAKLKAGPSVDLSNGTPFSNVRITDTGVVYSESTGTFSADASRSSVVVDLSAATIENFRFANALQRLSEKIARSGGRYYEYMKAIYGADIQDAKIDRAIFLGGDKTPIQISEVLQTSASQLTDDQPLGQMAGRAVAVGNDDYLEYVTPDNGFFIEITCALPRTNYQSGLAPYFSRFVRLDFATPDFAQLGEQPVLQKELWYSADQSEDEKPFGYQSRYYDMKYLRDRTSGSFKDSLDFWTWSRKFDEAPIAGQEFIEVRPDYRQFAVTDKSTEHIYVHMWHDLQVNRCLPVFGVPSL